MLKILIADDHEVVRRGIKQILLPITAEANIHEAKDGREALSRIQKTEYSIVLLDISMPGRNGLDTLQEIKKIKPDLPVLILSMYSENQYAMRALKAGAAGYISKDEDSNEVLAAIKKALSGNIHFSKEIVEELVVGYKRGWKVKPHDTLSIREMEVLHLIVAGYRLSEISEELSLSLSSISTYRRRILKKMNFKSTADIIKYAVENGLGN